MPFPISCQACEAAFSIDEQLFERRVAGRVVRFKCPSCGARSAVDAVVKDAWVRIGAGTEHSQQRLTEADLMTDEADVAELSDDEVRSLPPEALVAAKAARPRPRPRLESKIDDELWVVSVKEGVEDQEIFESSLTELIANGKMPPDAIVWREGIDNWVPLADVPELARHLPVTEDKTGGFLGTGMQVSFGSNAGERKSAPPPLPPKKRSYGNAKKKSYGGEGRAKPVALSPGFLFSVDDAESEPPPVVEEPRKGGKAVPKPPLKAPRRAVTRDLDFSDIAEDDVIPSSGAPALRDLTLPIKQANPTPKGPAAFLASLGGVEEQVLGPPSIDISDLNGAKPAGVEPPVELPGEQPALVSDVPTAPAAARSSEVPPSKKGKKGKAGRSKPPPSQAAAGIAERSASARPKERANAGQSDQALPSEVPEQAGWFTPGRVVVLLAIAALAYFLFSRQMQQAATTTAVPAQPSVAPPAATLEPLPEPTPVNPPAPSAVEPTAVEPSAPPVATPPGEPASPGPAQPRPHAATDGGSATPVKEPTPEPKPAPKPEATPTPKPEPTPANPDSPPFNKDAAVAALNTAVGQASGCRQEGDPSGTARVVVTFAPSGRVTSANLNGPPFAGTRTGGCIASTMRRAKIPAFSGSHVTVAKSVVIR